MKMKRFLALFLCLTMLLSLLPAVASADVDDGYYLVGSMNGWNANDNYKFTKIDGTNVYSLDLGEFPAGSSYKICIVESGNINWDSSDAIFSTNQHQDSAVTNARVFFAPEKNMPGWNGSCLCIGSQNANYETGYYLVGGMNGWAVNSDYLLISDGGNNYHIDVTTSADYQCKIMRVDFGAAAVYLWDGDNYYLPAGSRRVYFDASNLSNNGLSYNFPVADGYYLVGGTAVNGVGTWSPIDANRLTENTDGSHSLVKQVSYTDTEVAEYNDYKIVSVANGTITDWYGGNNDANKTLNSANSSPNRRFTFNPSDYSISEVYLYTVSAPSSISGGSITLYSTTAAEDEQVVFAVSPENGYQVASLTCKDASDNDVTIYPMGSGVTKYVTMPASNITINATFEPIPAQMYGLTVFNHQSEGLYNTTVSLKVNNQEVTQAAAGASVSITVTANNGYRVNYVTVKANTNGSDIEFDSGDTKNGTFTMPADIVNIDGGVVPVYPVSIVVVGSGTVASEIYTQYNDTFTETGASFSAAATDSLTFTPSAEPGYQVSSLVYKVDTDDDNNFDGETAQSVSGPFQDGSYEISPMPAHAVQVTATFVPIPPTAYQINKYGITETGCSVHAEVGGVEVESAVEGAQVTIVATPGTGYYVESYILDGNASSQNTFTMPASAVIIGAMFEKTNYTITKSATNGTVSATVGGNAAATANYGDTVTLSNEPATGYALVGYTFTPEGGVAQAVEGNTFTMPAANVTVTATFEEIPPAIENGYYLVGSMNSWGATAEYKMTEGEGGLYYIDTTLTSGTEFKAAQATNGVLTMLPGEGQASYSVTATGAVRIWLNPAGTNDDGWHCRYLRVENGFYLASSADVENGDWVWNTHPLTLENGVFTITAVDWPKDTEFKIVGVFNYGGQEVWFGTDNNGHNGASNYSVSEGGTYKITFDREVATATIVQENAPTLESAFLSLDGNIGVNFRISLPVGVEANTVTAEFYLGDAESPAKTVLLSTLTPVEGKYIVGYSLPARLLAQNVKIKVKVGDTYKLQGTTGSDLRAGFETSAVACCNAYIGGEYADTVKNLAQALLYYGGYADLFLNEGTTVLPDYADGAEAAVAAVPNTDDQGKNTAFDAFKIKRSLDGTNLTLSQVYLTLVSETELNLVFTAGDGFVLDNTVFACAGHTVTATQSGNTVTVKISGIAAKDLDTQLTLTINETCFVKVGALYYGRMVLKKSNDATLKNLVKALYLYNVAADAYFTSLAQN